MAVRDSRIEGLYKMSVAERVSTVAERVGLSDQECDILREVGLPIEVADKMIENVIGVFPLPYAIAPNFLINGKEYLVPMVVEEPSIVAAASFMAKLARESGGFIATYSGSYMIAQMHVLNVRDPHGARLEIIEHIGELIMKANTIDKTLVNLGGGARDIDVRILHDTDLGQVLAVHLIVDVRDAMGANTVNTMAERLAGDVERITGGTVLLRILSNLADRRIARARIVVKTNLLETKDYSGEEIADGIVKAYKIADTDPYRAATHNKGILNGIDAVAVATGNDWRAIEAGAHAWAAITGRYRSLSTWERNKEGELVGTLELPMAVGIVGGATKTHPLAQLSLRILGVSSAEELAQVMVSVGLAQNMAALRVLSTEGVQRGHMELHARNIAIQADVPSEAVEWVIARMVEMRDVRVDKAKELTEEWYRLQQSQEH